MRKLNILLVLLLSFSYSQSQEITGDWYGILEVNGIELPLVFHLKENDTVYSSTMDSPKQGAFDIKLDQPTFKNSILELSLLRVGMHYSGNYNEETEKIQGTFKQNGMSFPLILSREKSTESTPIVRPQEPKEPYPYYSEDVSFLNQEDGIKLSGTLSLPENVQHFPVVILISGSGPQDRNEEIVNHKPFLVLSDYLTRNGIGVLRYDDRGVGKSEGDYSKATSEDLSRDVEAAIKYLQSRKDIDANKIGLIGHSEGGIIAPMVAQNSKDVKFMVLLAGPGLRGDKIMLLQKKVLEEKRGADELVVEKGQETFKGAYDIILASGENDDLKTLLKEYFSNSFKNSLSENQISSLVESITTPWMQYFLKHDPSKILEKTEIPVLALFGKKDVQVPAKENAEILRASLEKAGNKNVKVMELENLNHLFQESETGLPNEYSKIEQTISPKVLDIISSWIQEINQSL